MQIQPDFRDLLALFNALEVEYVIVGAYALAFHGAPRYTGDLDVYVRPRPDNARKLIEALARFGFGGLDLTPADFQSPDRIVQLGVPPVRVDLITSITGVTWEEAVAHRVAGRYGETPVHYLGRDQLIANKRATGRKKDLADIESLGAG